MTKTLILLPALALLGPVLAACVTTGQDQPVRILRSTADGVVLHGLIDATRSSPPARYDTLAQSECARAGKKAAFMGMEQRSTFGFDVTYRCIGQAEAV
ncbi:hypothetical protein [Pseudogemmobacter humi]|uniref:Lipoprotein n=1 Tax=Pseudogemmobacter humi TaxID=2483812 RepID=A0A3P5X0T0_9RHOB|nr:hypothetical protein [Pseudogemmobacter humi]VDC24831.1 hypothetical protein XINFAN_01308 [Pseudogemmobacter humi]